MARFRLLTPDAQYADDGIIERQTAGDDVDWDIHRSRTLAELPSESVAACDAMVVWHEMKIDRRFRCGVEALPHHRAGRRRLRPYRSRRRGRGRHPRLQHARLRHQRGR